MLARRLVEERERPDRAAEVGAARRRLERGRRRRRTREMAQAVARSESAGTARGLRFASHGHGPGEGLIRACRGDPVTAWLRPNPRRRTRVHDRRPEAGRARQADLDGQAEGIVTYEEVNDALPGDLVSMDQLDDIMLMFGAMDIEVVDSAKAPRILAEIEDSLDEREETGRPRAASRSICRRGPSGAPKTRCGCTCGRWAEFRCSPARARSRWPTDRGGQGRGRAGRPVDQPRQARVPGPPRGAPQGADLGPGHRRQLRRGVHRGTRGRAGPQGAGGPHPGSSGWCATPRRSQRKELKPKPRNPKRQKLDLAVRPKEQRLFAALRESRSTPP